MKLRTTFLLCFLATQLSFSQDLNSLKTGADKIYQATMKLDYDKILDLTYPRVFDIAPRDQMKELLKSTFNGTDDMKVKIINIPPDFKYGEIKKIEDKTFCLITHNLCLELIMTEPMSKEEGDLMVSMMKESMETNDVTFEDKTGTLKITKRSTMIAVSDAKTKNEWRFLNQDKGNKVASYLFSEKIIKQLGL